MPQVSFPGFNSALQRETHYSERETLLLPVHHPETNSVLFCWFYFPFPSLLIHIVIHIVPVSVFPLASGQASKLPLLSSSKEAGGFSPPFSLV